MAPAPWFDFSSGYIQRAMERFPKLGPAAPWRAHQNYLKDLMMFRAGRVDDGVLRFSSPPAAPAALAKFASSVEAVAA